MKRIAVAAAAMLLGAFAVSPSQAQEPIRIGAIVSKTGPAAFLGEPEELTLRHYTEKLNAEGGLLGRPVELVLYDDASDPNTGRTLATRLVEDDGIVAAIATSTTGGTLALAPVFENAEIPVVSLAAGIGIVEPVRPYVFKTPHTDRMVCAKVISDMKSRGFKGIALITGTDGVGKSMRQECSDAAAAQSIEVLADESFNPKDVDMTPQLTKIKNTEGVEAVFIGGFGQSLSVVTRNYRQLGITIPQYQNHGAASKSFIELSGKASEGVLVPGPLLLIAGQLSDDNPLKKVATEYSAAYTELTGQEVSTFGGYAYDALLLIADAIRRANSDDPAAIRDALEATKDLPGVTGMFNMSASDHLGIDQNSLYMVEIKDGDWELIDK